MEIQDRKTKNTIKSLTIVGIVLILALIASIVYFFVLKDDQGDEDIDLSHISCGCYLIDPAVVNGCGDPRRAFSFNLNTVSSDKVCSAECDMNKIANNLLNTTTPKDSLISCPAKSISDTRCENIILKDQNDKIITGKIQPGDEINVEATFDKSTYTEYVFIVNSETITPDKVLGNVITKKIIPPADNDSIEIQATAKDELGERIDSGVVCRRIVAIEKTSGTAVTGITAITEQQSDGKTKISNISISVGQIDSENVKIRFSFEPAFTELVIKDGITIEPLKGTLEISKLELYEPSNFTEGSFNILNNHTGTLKITADVFVNEISIGSDETTVTFVDTSTQNPVEQPIPDAQKSDFTVTKTVAPSCVERVAGVDSTTYTITINNRKNNAEGLTSIKDKLPLGFVYVVDSSILNGITTPDSGLVTVNQIGDSQEIIWTPSTPWSIAPGGSMTVVFQAKATPTAITGQNLNEVILNPVEIPLDPSTLRTQVYVVVAQDCGNITEEEGEIPQTGIFDNFITRILLGIFLLVIGWIVYTRPAGNLLSESILKSKIYSDYELTKYRFINPKKYFEERILRKKSKGN